MFLDAAWPCHKVGLAKTWNSITLMMCFFLCFQPFPFGQSLTLNSAESMISFVFNGNIRNRPHLGAITQEKASFDLTILWVNNLKTWSLRINQNRDELDWTNEIKKSPSQRDFNQIIVLISVQGGLLYISPLSFWGWQGFCRFLKDFLMQKPPNFW